MYSEKSPMDMRTPPLKIKIMLESNPLKSEILVGRLGVYSLAWQSDCPSAGRPTERERDVPGSAQGLQ